jgi:methylmalonyl-CoA mutase cobalamin-binding subunit
VPNAKIDEDRGTDGRNAAMTPETTRQMTGAKMVVEALKEQGVEVVFGYPGGCRPSDLR